MSNLGDSLLYALSAVRVWSWSAFKKAFDEPSLARPSAHNTPDSLSGLARWRCAMLLDSLGHCDFVLRDESWQMLSAPAILVDLPTAGLPRAVLCGSRSPETLPTLLRHARRLRKAVRVVSRPQHAIRYYAPTRIEVEANDHSAMIQFGKEVGLRVAQVPPSWPLALRAGGLSGYLSGLVWSDDPEIGWRRQDFDPDSGGFGAPGDTLRRLSRYQDPIRGLWRYRLVCGASSTAVDPAWGRWAALHWASRHVVKYDPSKGLFSVPASVQIPRLIARALVLCSGRPPGLAKSGACEAPAKEFGAVPASWVETYSVVPAEVAGVITSKLGQSKAGLPGEEKK